MAIYQNEWITIELNGALPKRMDHVKLNGSQMEWLIVNWMAYPTSKLNGKLPKLMDHYWIECRVTKTNGSR